jgi:hypothetical protein
MQSMQGLIHNLTPTLFNNPEVLGGEGERNHTNNIFSPVLYRVFFMIINSTTNKKDSLFSISMAIKTLMIFCFSFFTLSALSQKLLRGQVIDGQKNKPVPFASVFLNNTSVGTKTNEQGMFELNIPDGKYELIVSSVGYETYNQTIVAKEINETISINLKVKAPELESIIIEAFEKDG